MQECPDWEVDEARERPNQRHRDKTQGSGPNRSRHGCSSTCPPLACPTEPCQSARKQFERSRVGSLKESASLLLSSILPGRHQLTQKIRRSFAYCRRAA